MQRLDYYEFLGHLAPGGTLLFGVSRVYPEVGAALAASSLKIGKAIELESILDGDSLPTYKDLAPYVFYTATGEEFEVPRPGTP